MEKLNRMAKGYILSCIILLLIPIYGYSLPCDSIVSNEVIVDRNCIIETAEKEIGVKELSNRNDGKRVEEYLATTNLGGGYAWCAAFIKWVYMKCGYSVPYATAYSPTWFNKSNTIYTKGINKEEDVSIKSGYVFGIWFADKNRIAHVGIIYEWKADSNYVVTIEGNTNDKYSVEEQVNRDGEGVYKKKRLKSQIYKIANP
jgi:hypothetical protein